jgi:D-alanyl-D-alanine dipeptidase
MSYLPKGFVYLSDVEDTILQDIRYAYDHNFIGKPLNGYEAEKCVLSEKMVEPLKAAQKQAMSHGLTIKVYEAYRPLRAVSHIVEWAHDSNDQLMKEEFYKHIDKSNVFELGYVAVRSAHCRGAAVDLTLVNYPISHNNRWQKDDPLVDGIAKTRFNDNSIDMGTGFDCFHENSHTASQNISIEARKNRDLLCEIMHTNGFKNYSKEWWHFNLI